MKYKLTPVHINDVKPGNTIEFEGHLRTVCKNDIKKGFCGVTLFGDSYRLGTQPVLLATN